MSRTPHDLRKTHTFHDGWARLRVGLFAMAAAVFVYLAVMLIPPGLFTYLLTLPAAGIVLITAWSRVNALGIELASTVWNVRRGGLILTALFAMGVIAWPLLQGEWTPWIVVIGIWGFAKTWLTTPHQPPWKTLVFGPYVARANENPHRRKEDDFDSNP